MGFNMNIIRGIDIFEQLNPLRAYIFLLLYSMAGFSQTSGQLLEASLDPRIPFTVTRYSSKQGLPQSQVISILPKKNGNLLISTANGLVECNGIVFKPVVKDGEDKAFIFTKLFLHEASGHLFGERLNGPLHALAPDFRQLNNCRTTCLVNDSLFGVDQAGILYGAAAKDGLFKKIAETGVITPNCILNDGYDFLIGNDSAAYRFNRRSRSITRIVSDVVIDMKRNPYDRLAYVISDQRIYRLQKDQAVPVLQFKNTGILFNDIDFTGAGSFFAATTQGLFELRGETVRHYTAQHGLPTLYLQSLYYDSDERCLFLGTGDKGLLKLQFKTCSSLSSRQGFNEAAALSSIIQDHAGNILVSAGDTKIYKIEEDTVYPFVATANMNACLSEIDGALYAGSWGAGVKVIRDRKAVYNIRPPQLATGFVHAVFRDSRNWLWVGGDGIARGTAPENIAPYLPGQVNGGIVVITELRNGNICFGSTNGLFIINKSGFLIKHIGREEGLMGKELRAFYEDAEGKLWIGTYGSGLYCYHNDRLTSINQMKNARLNNDVFSLVKDRFGYLYMTSNHGLWRVKEKDLDDFYKGHLDYLIPFYYCMETGILNEEFNGGFQNDYLETAGGSLYFPSLQGVVRVKPEQPHFRKLSPAFNRVLVNDTLSPLTINSFRRSTYSIQFDFESVTFLNKYNVHYQYRLAHDGGGDWSALQKETSVSFKMLPPGPYTLYLRAIDAHNDIEPSVISFAFLIEPYLYETAWFKMLLLFLFVLLIFAVSLLSLRYYRRKAEERERIKRELAELELKAVQAQMNPHFIFNSLNSIKHYLYINDTRSADVFIDTFSVLLRDFLEYSNKDFIPLEKEAEMLASYLSLESMRMNPPFRYSIGLPPELHKLKVPTLLFQAFVENAVKHGITHSPEEGVIDISFRLVEGTVLCAISDNGIGRAKALVIRGQKSHPSKGIGIVKDKIKIVKATHNLQVEVSMEDLHPGRELPGTLVLIKIPLRHD